MTSSESPLIHDVERSYGSVASTSAANEPSGEVQDGSHPPVPGSVAGNIGMLFIVSSQFFFACMNISVKMLNRLDPPVHALEVVLVRMGITLLGCVIYMFVKRIPDPIIGPKGVRTLLVTRGITGFVSLSALYWALQYLSVADTTVLIFLVPLTSALSGCIFLKEGYSIKQACAGVFSLLGVVLIAHPPFLFGSLAAIPAGSQASKVTPLERLLGVGACMINVLGATGAYTTIRAIGKRAHPIHIMMPFALWSTIMAPLGMVVLKIPFVYPKSWMWTVILLLVGVFGFMAQTLLTMGLQRETVSRGSSGIYVQMLFAVVLEVLFFGILPSLSSVLGATIIISSAVYVVLTKQKP